MRKQIGMIAFGLTTLLLVVSAQASLDGNTMEVSLGTTIDRTWTDIVADGYAYGAYQTYNSETDATKVYLPYGNTDGGYWGVSNVGFTDASSSTNAQYVSSVGSVNTTLSFKLYFDENISSFTFKDAWTYIVLSADGTDTIAAETCYSTDGVNWTTMSQVQSSYNAAPEPFTLYTAEELNTDTLYIMLRSYDLTNPDDTSGGNRYLQGRQSGAGSWGEEAFKANMWYVEVTSVPEPATMCLLAAGGIGIFLKRRK